MLKSNISGIYTHNYTKTKINSDDDFPIEKTITMHNVIMLIKFAYNENHNHSYYKLFFKKLFI